jgi:hypothetical protein
MAHTDYGGSFRSTAAARRKRYAVRFQSAVIAALLLVIGAFRFEPAPQEPSGEPGSGGLIIYVVPLTPTARPLRSPPPVEVADSVAVASLRDRALDFDATLDP